MRKPITQAGEPLRFERTELRVTAVISCIISVRMLGLFMLLPVMVLGGSGYANATPMLIGLAFSVYGLTQAALQAPLGAASDRFGRKPVIALGLLLFIAGSAAAAAAEAIAELIAARALQGAGAVGTAALAYVSDTVRERLRAKANAMIGMGIGLSFMLGMVIGPALLSGVGMAAIFMICAALGVVAMALAIFALPGEAAGRAPNAVGVWRAIGKVVGERQLTLLFGGGFFLHLMLTSSFMLLPAMLGRTLSLGRHWLFYAVTLSASFLPVLPLLAFGERVGCVRRLFLAAIVCCGVSMASLPFVGFSLPAIGVAVIFFFAAFNLLEASLPALVSRLCPGAERGASIGLLATGQFLGTFVGGVIAGWGLQLWGDSWIALIGLLAAALWLLAALDMKEPPRLLKRGAPA